MGGVVFLFPGQGSQYAGMSRELADSFPAARGVFEEADQALGFSVSQLCFSGPEEALKLTENTQPAILTASVAAYYVLKQNGVCPDYVAGHSLGEYSALVAAGALKFADAIRLVRKRGQYMQEAVPRGEGAMAAILGMRPGQVAEICRKTTDGKVMPANLNSPDQTVISGDAAAVKSAVEQASAAGAKRAVMLPVSAPFHSELMRPAQERLEKDLRATEFSALKFPLVTNVDASIITSGAEAREALIRQVTLPVRWEDSMRELIEQGAATFVEVGPGRVLSGLLRQIDRSVHSLNVEDVKSLQIALDRLTQIRGEENRSRGLLNADAGPVPVMFSLKDRVALVTGASQGIGRAIALALSCAGARVVIAARNAEKLQALADEIGAAQGAAFAVQMDVSDPQGVKAGFHRAVERFGRLDILVNNAAITRDGLALRMKTEDWEAVLRTNLTGAYFCIQQALAVMLRQRSGRIINVTSVVAQSGNAGQANYIAAKAGLIGLTRAIATEVASRNITVNAVAPGFIVSPMTDPLAEKVKEELVARIPLGRMGRDAEVAAAVVFLASDEAGYITGHVLDVNGGMRMN